MTHPSYRIRIVSIDHHMMVPHQKADSAAPLGAKVPVIRIFGIRDTGQKTVVHMHGLYPYFYIDYSGDTDSQSLSKYLPLLSASIDKALQLSLGKKETLNAVVAVIPVKGIKFYGFSSSYSCFLKIYIYDPSLVTRIVKLMESGSILGQEFITYESHIPYMLQFFVDYNLFGFN